MNQFFHCSRPWGWLFLVVLLWGVNSVSIKYLTSFFPPFALAPIRLTLASLPLLSFVFYQYGFRALSMQAFLPIGGIALFCIFLHQIALTLGLAATSSTHSVLILGLSPLLTVAGAMLYEKESLAPAKLLGVFLGFCGLGFVVLGKSQYGATLVGDALILLATLTFVIGSFFVKKATLQLPPLVVTAYSHALAAAALVLLGLLTNSTWMYASATEPFPIAVLLFSSFMSTALGALLWNMSIQQVGPSTASLFQNATPVIGILASSFFLNEELAWNHFCALTLVLCGVFYGTGIIQLPNRMSASIKKNL
ncbi:DMT family transporter [Anaeroarcus burkinensis]|uniref:DMT family transporter n=1 Tax=Anaeroarcus burkinensis TaxID=82376 RepID=UPI0003F583DA|nr:DMT family transporter [Anaeroarcus burkinensis]